jgi:N-acylneuraminate cytidylyltransferase/CMP-N,N'-diacetyllegionaminic acid synthase
MLCIIPARGGSRGLKNKNILRFNGKPLIYYTIQAALKSKKITKVIVITDSLKIAKISKKFGAEIPFLRPKKLAKNNSLAIDTYIYVINKLKKKFSINEFIVLLPTSPLRDNTDIENAINLFRKKKADSVISMKEVEYPVDWIKRVNKSYLIESYNKNFKSNFNRQYYKKTFVPNGAIYIFNSQKFLRYKDYYFKRTFAYLMSKKKSTDINDLVDFKTAEFLKRNSKNFNI